MNCFVCKKNSSHINLCSGCNCAIYCSKQCEELAWVTYHREECNIKCRPPYERNDILTKDNYIAIQNLLIVNPTPKLETFIIMKYIYKRYKMYRDAPWQSASTTIYKRLEVCYDNYFSRNLSSDIQKYHIINVFIALINTINS